MAACAIAAPRAWAAADNWALGRTLGLIALVTAGIVFLDNISYFPGALSHLRRADALRGFLYLVPQAFPLALPAAVLFGVVFGFRGRPITDRLRRATLAIGVCGTVASFVTLAWIAPISNQAFRSAASGIPSDKLGKGPAELTLLELRAKRAALDRSAMRDSVQARNAAFNYQARLALSCTPIVLGLLALAFVGARRRARRVAIGAWAVSSCVAYWVMLMASGRAVVLGGTPAVIVWIPNLLGLAGTYWLRSRSTTSSSS